MNRSSTFLLTTLALAAGTAPALADSTERVSVGPHGRQANLDSAGGRFGSAVSADGRYVAFAAAASNLVAGDTNGQDDIFVRDRKTGTTERVSVSSAGGQANGFSDEPAISGDGRIVAFSSDARNLVAGDNGCCAFDVFVHDLKTGRTEVVDLGPGGVTGTGVSGSPSLSKDGRFVAFDSKATNLVPGDTNRSYDVFVRDRQAGTTERVSVRPGGNQANGISGYPSISADGQLVAFTSIAPNLVAGDTNGTHDIFLRDRQHHTTTRVSVGADGAQGNAGTEGAPAISADGHVIAFQSDASNLVQGDTNGVLDTFVRTR